MAVTFTDAPALPEWLACELPFERRMADVAGTRLHLVDHHREHPHAILMMHGNPTWCYLWRKVMTALSPHPLRLIAPDLLGLGLSDKPRSVRDHSLARQIDLMVQLVEALAPERLTVVGQDWGGPIAAGVAAAMPERVHSAVFANTAVLAPSRFRTTAFHRFSHLPLVSDLAFRGLNFPVPILGRVQGDPASLDRRARRAYHWPLRRLRDRAAPLAMARMVPNAPDHPSMAALAAGEAWLRAFEGPAALVWGLRDPILGRALRRLAEALPQAEVTETQAGHFLQEEVPGPLAAAVVSVAGL